MNDERESDLQRRIAAWREQEKEQTPAFERVWRRAQRARQTSTASSGWRWRRVFGLGAVAATLMCLSVLWWRREPDTLRAGGESADALSAAAQIAASDWEVPSDLLLADAASQPSLQIAGLVGEINSLLQP